MEEWTVYVPSAISAVVYVTQNVKQTVMARNGVEYDRFFVSFCRVFVCSQVPHSGHLL